MWKREDAVSLLDVHHRELFCQQLLLHEGLRLKPYRCTANKLTIGVGYNIDDRGIKPLEAVIGRKVDLRIGITEPEAMLVLDADIDRFEAAVVRLFPVYKDLDMVRRRVVLDLAFNLGYRALGFRNTMRAVQRSDWDGFADGLRQSLWSTQVGDGPGKRYDRADRLIDMGRTGLDYIK
jgi:lysozyme